MNVSTDLAEVPGLLGEVLGSASRPVVVELGEGEETESDAIVTAATLPQGVMVAIDDAGAGYESLARMDRLRPSFMKLHRASVAGIQDDTARKAFVRTLVTFGEEHGCQVIAEGIETEAEKEALRDAGVQLGQGFLLGRPVPVDRTSDEALRR